MSALYVMFFWIPDDDTATFDAALFPGGNTPQMVLPREVLKVISY